jgi:hypothetical protein
MPTDLPVRKGIMRRNLESLTKRLITAASAGVIVGTLGKDSFDYVDAMQIGVFLEAVYQGAGIIREELRGRLTMDRANYQLESCVGGAAGYSAGLYFGICAGSKILSMTS